MRVYRLFILCMLLSFTSCFKHQKKLFVDNRIDEYLYKYVNNNPNFTSILVMSSKNFLPNGKKDISGVLIGPLYDGYRDSFGDIQIRYLTTYLGKQIFIDSVALTITKKQVQKSKKIAYCERDSFFIFDNCYKDALLNYIKRATVLNILVKNGVIINIEALKADSVYFPIMRLDEPVFIDEEEMEL